MGRKHLPYMLELLIGRVRRCAVTGTRRANVRCCAILARIVKRRVRSD